MNWAETKALQLEKSYGHGSAQPGTFIRPVDVIPTGVLSLDYALGTGGWPSGSIIEVYGLHDIGKSLLLLSGVREAQRLSKKCGWIALEPGYSSAWATKHGVDPENIVVAFPDDGKVAFDILQDMVLDPDVEFIVFDSIGQVLRESESKADGNPSAGGQSALITWGVKRANMAAYKMNKYVVFLNQVRDVMSARVPLLDSPGGHNLKHSAEIRVHLRPGKDKYKIKLDEADVTIGHQVIAEIKRTKRDEGTGKRAVYDIYTRETEGYPFGVDIVTDVLTTGQRTNIIVRAGAWYNYEEFPDGKLMGKEQVAEWLKNNPSELDVIREKIIETIR